MGHITIEGELTFDDDRALEQGFDAFYAVEPAERDVEYKTFQRRGVCVHLRYDEHGSYEQGLAIARKLAALARLATAGAFTVNAATVAAGGEAPSLSLPRHYRYELYDAASTNNVPRLQTLIALGASLEGRYGGSGVTLLHVAARMDTPAAVEALLAAGMDVNATDRDGAPAIGSNRLSVARVLLAAGADVNAHGARSSPLYAAMYQAPEVAELLLNAGAVPRPGELVSLAEHWIGMRRIPLLRSLLALTPDLQAAMVTPGAVAAAIRSKDPVTLDFILELGGVLPDDFLAQAVYWSVPDLVVVALRAPDSLTRCGPSNDPEDAMCVAARHGDVAILELLAAHGVPVHPRTRSTTTPFHEAGSRAVLEWLVAHGAPYDEDAAYRMRAPEPLMFFIERGIDPNDPGLREDFTAAENVEFWKLVEAWQKGRR